MKVALITGVNGQDGSYLSEFLLSKGYMVHGIKRRSSTINTGRVDHLYHNPNFKMHYGDVTDSTSIVSIIKRTQPDEIYNLAAMSHVKVSFETAEYTANVNAIGALRILEAIRILGMEKTTKFYQASTSEMFGEVLEIPQNENTPFNPRSPYAIAKQFAHAMVKDYREAYGMFACSGILFNHESPVRGETFITRKITRSAVAYQQGLLKKIYVGNLDAQRDWGHAYDYVRAMYYMLQQKKPKDYVVATGVTTTVRDMIIMVFDILGMKLSFRKDEWNPNDPITEVGGIDIDGTWTPIIFVDPNYFRPTEVEILIGDPKKAKAELGWSPCYDLRSILQEMVEHDKADIKKNGYNG